MSLTYLLIFFFIAVELLLFSLIKVHRKSFPWLIVKKDKFPVFQDQLLKKYFENSFNKDLGWARKHGKDGIDKSPEGNSKYSISLDGSRYNPDFQNLRARIHVYGDSFAFCRLVNDNETWSYFLSKSLNENVLNYGAGNYGLDQAYLRFLKNIPQQDQKKIIIMNVVPETILRIHSQWKHFLEYGNILAFKPSFKLSNQYLKKQNNPIQKIQDFRNIKEIILSLSKSDPFYKEKFQKDIITFPHILSIFRNLKIIKLLWILSTSRSKNAKKKAFSIILSENHKLQNRYFKNSNKVNLLEKLVESFSKSAKENNLLPILIVMPQPNDLIDIKKGKALYQKIFQDFNKYLPVYDMAELFLNCEENIKIYKSGDLGDHPSPELNFKIAEKLRKIIKELEVK